MKKVCKFLKADINDDLIDQIVDKCHIDKMRHAVKDNDTVKTFLVDGKPLMYRKGNNCSIPTKKFWWEMICSTTTNTDKNKHLFIFVIWLLQNKESISFYFQAAVMIFINVRVLRTTNS